jgi:outer membrane receptor protein involved in Fe transport
LSRYVRDFARHRAAAAVDASLSDTMAIGARVGHTARVDGRAYTLVDARVSRRLGAFRVAVDLRNLLDEDYQEIVGVEMPGRNGRVELAWTAR